MLDAIRFGLCAALAVCGLFLECCSVLGVNRFRFVLNRMHAAALGDTMGVLLTLLSLCVWSADGWIIVKLLLVIFLFWLSGPIVSHMIGRLEYTTDTRLWSEVSEWKS